MKLRNKLFIGLVALALASCNNNATTKTSASKTDAADAIYFGGDIITMEGDSAAYAEAVAVKDGKIVFVGSIADAEKMKGGSTAMNDNQLVFFVDFFYKKAAILSTKSTIKYLIKNIGNKRFTL